MTAGYITGCIKDPWAEFRPVRGKACTGRFIEP